LCKCECGKGGSIAVSFPKLDDVRGTVEDEDEDEEEEEEEEEDEGGEGPEIDEEE